jgi:hypothetical protein
MILDQIDLVLPDDRSKRRQLSLEVVDPLAQPIARRVHHELLFIGVWLGISEERGWNQTLLLFHARHPLIEGLQVLGRSRQSCGRARETVQHVARDFVDQVTGDGGGNFILTRGVRERREDFAPRVQPLLDLLEPPRLRAVIPLPSKLQTADWSGVGARTYVHPPRLEHAPHGREGPKELTSYGAATGA